VAGDGGIAYFGDGGQATSTLLRNPHGIVIDASWNMYFVDKYAHSSHIRMVTKSTGIITTVVGNGKYRNAGYCGDGGPATSVSLNDPIVVALDRSGNICIADSANHRIRKVSRSTGIITTVAGNGTEGYIGDGGPATSATLNHSNGVALDESGNIYIADSANHRIRMMTKSIGIISTLAGGNLYAGQYDGDGAPAKSARFCCPYRGSVDASGKFCIADSQNDQIRMMTKSTGIISTVVCSHPGAGDSPGHDGDQRRPVSCAIPWVPL
jgi:NHL repeat